MGTALLFAMLTACPTAELVRSDSTILVVQARLQASLDPPSKTQALRLVLDTAIDRKLAALALCDDSLPVKVSPFEDDYQDPFEQGSDDEMAYSVTVDLVGISGWATP
jgi:hypothetical protein